MDTVSTIEDLIGGDEPIGQETEPPDSQALDVNNNEIQKNQPDYGGS